MTSLESLQAINMFQKIILLALRISLGWIFFYSGITKILNPNWTAAGFLKGAQTMSFLYQWLANSQNIGWVNFVNEWGQLLIGISLILGILVKVGALSGILIMLLYYLPVLKFPYAGKNSFLVDDHIIYSLVFLALYAFDAGKYWGLEKVVRKNQQIN